MNPKNLVKPILCILGGAALGGGVSYFFARREIKDLENRVYPLESAVIEILEKLESDTKKEELNTLRSDDGTEFTNDLNRGELTINASIKKPAILELMDKVSKAAQLPAETLFSPITMVDNDPFLVAENAIDLNDDKYDSEVAYTYYEDGILTDENDDPVVDPDDILPSGWRDCFGWNCRSDDMFFAINPKLRLLIEVGKSGYEYNGVYHDDSWEE